MIYTKYKPVQDYFYTRWTNKNMMAFVKIIMTRTPTKAITARTVIIATRCVILLLLICFCQPASSQLYEGSECEMHDGTLGTCKVDQDCQWLKDNLQRRTIQFSDISRCSFSGSSQIICCGDEQPTVSKTTPTPFTHGNDDFIFFESSHQDNLPLHRSSTNAIFPKTPIVSTMPTIFHPQITFSHPQFATATHRVASTLPPRSGKLFSERPAFATSIPRRSTIYPQSPSFVPSISTTSPPFSVAIDANKNPSRIVNFPTTPPPTWFYPTTRQSNVQWPTVAPVTQRPIVVWPTTTQVPHNIGSSFWQNWSPNNDVEVISNNSLTHTHADLVGPLINGPFSTPPTPTPSKADIELVDSWLLDILAEARQNQSSLPIQQFPSSSGDGSITSTSTTVTTSNTALPVTSNNNDLYPLVTRPSATERSTPTPTTSPPARLGNLKIEEACERFTSLSKPFISFHILGGSPTELGEFPHMAALGYPNDEVNSDEDFRFNCGGSLISEEYVLTAAHCVTGRIVPTVVRMGKIYLHTNEDETAGLTSNIARIVVFPQYNTSRNYHDIALVQLAQAVQFNDNIRPACLYTEMEDVPSDVSLTVTGWGLTSVERMPTSETISISTLSNAYEFAGAVRSPFLLKTNLTSMALPACNSSLLEYERNNRRIPNGLNMGQLCASDPAAKNDACQGDSGGPLQINHANGMSTIVGVTSFGITCGSQLPSVYARVAFYLDWIESMVWPGR